MKDIKTSCEIHVNLTDIKEITGKDYYWLFNKLDIQFSCPFIIWCDEDEGVWFDWADDDDKEWIEGWKEIRNFFLEQCFQIGQIIWINIEE